MAKPRCFLVSLSGENAGRSYPVYPQGVLIGRDSIACDIIINSSRHPDVSRTHCYVTYNPITRLCIIQDRRSSFGTYTANGRRIKPKSPVALHNYERFYLSCPDNLYEVRMA